MDLDVAIYMGLSPEDVKNAGSAKNCLEALWPMFSALRDPKRQTAVVNLDGEFLRFQTPLILCCIGYSRCSRPIVAALIVAIPHHGNAIFSKV